MKKFGLLVLSFVLIGVAQATEICAHRGDVQAAPENTLVAIRTAIAKGAAMVEFDVYASKDGELVVIHDATVDRTTEATGKVTDFTFEELRSLNAADYFEGGEVEHALIPTLEEVLMLVPEGVWCNAHLKNSPGVAAKSATKIKELDKLGQCFLACTEEQIAEARAVVPEIQVCNMSRQTGDRDAYIDMTIDLECEFIQLHQAQGTEGLKEDVERLHEAEVKVNFYGANDRATMETLKSAGVDYVLTDRIDIAREVLRYRPYVMASMAGTVSTLEGTVALDLNYPVFTLEDESWNDTLNTFVHKEMIHLQTGFVQDMSTYHAEIMAEPRSLGVTETQNSLTVGPFAVTLNRPGLVCMRMFTWFYSGGAHGLSTTATYNLMKQVDGSIKELGYEDVFLADHDVLPSVSYMLIEGLRDQGASYVINGSLAYFTKEDIPGFTLEERGVRFYVDPYQAGPYAQGDFEVFLGYDALLRFIEPDLLDRILPKKPTK